jgi:hypothetical protein
VVYATEDEQHKKTPTSQQCILPADISDTTSSSTKQVAAVGRKDGRV